MQLGALVTLAFLLASAEAFVSPYQAQVNVKAVSRAHQVKYLKASNSDNNDAGPGRRTTTTTTTTTTMNKDDTNTNTNSCSTLNLSWLSESVMEAALDTKNLSLRDIHQLETGLKAAEQFGQLDLDSSDRLHHKLQVREADLMRKAVKLELRQVAKRMQLFCLLKTYKTWEQVQSMADMHGQGAYILMKDFQGLSEPNVERALKGFHDFLRENTSRIPFSSDLAEEKDAAKIRRMVAAKLCHAYQALTQSLQNDDLGGYDPTFLQGILLYRVEDLMALWGVKPQEVNPTNPLLQQKQQDEENKMLGDKTDDEASQEDDDPTYRDDDEEDYPYPAGRY